MSDAPHDLTMAGHAKMLARTAAALAKELGKLDPWRGDVGRDRELARMIAQLADIVAELAALNAKPCDDRTCTDRDHWAPTGRINHGSTPTTCVHGQDHSDSLTCEYRCAATMPGHWCTRREHADDRHVWAMSDEEAERHLREEDWFADPLDESDHRPRHDRGGGHLYRHGHDHWHSWARPLCSVARSGHSDALALNAWNVDFGPLTFCDCDDTATIEAENGATD